MLSQAFRCLIPIKAILFASLALALVAPDVAKATNSDLIPELPLGIRPQQVLKGASFAGQQISAYKFTSPLTPEALLDSVEMLWREAKGAHVWRSETAMWKVLSRVVRFPELEVLQVKAGLGGQTIANLSVARPMSAASSEVAIPTAKWLPPGCQVIQSLANPEQDGDGYLIIAKSALSVEQIAAHVKLKASESGFGFDKRLTSAASTTGSQVMRFTRTKQAVILTLDKVSSGVDIVLQFSREAP